MKIIFIITLLLPLALLSQPASYSLFNGRDLSGWHIDVPEMDTNALAINPFIIRNGLLVSLGEPNGHLITDSVYQNFRLQVEYRFAGKPGNCGVLVFASTPRSLMNCGRYSRTRYGKTARTKSRMGHKEKKKKKDTQFNRRI